MKIKIEKSCQNEHSGKAMVACDSIEKDSETNQKLIEKLKEHELGLNHVSFRCTS